MRTFIAIDLPETIRGHISQATQSLQRLPQLKWSKPENWHITLNFLGEITQTQLARVKQKMVTIAANTTSFNLQLTKLYLFPNTKYPQVVSLEVKPIKQITTLAMHLADALISCNILKEQRPYTPHLTLARINNEAVIQEKLLQAIKLDDVILPVSTIKLFKSELTSAGSIYSELFCCKFNSDS